MAKSHHPTKDFTSDITVCVFVGEEMHNTRLCVRKRDVCACLEKCAHGWGVVTCVSAMHVCIGVWGEGTC